MTDDTGMLQHAIFSIPRYEDGYCVDDNARALLLMTLLEDAGWDDPTVVRALARRYLAFASHAFDRTSGRFRNFLSDGRHWLEPCGSEDSHGRTLWALGAVVGRAGDPGRHSLAGDLFDAALPAVTTFTSPRAWAYALLGIDEYLRAFQGDSTVEARRVELADRLLGLFQRTSRPDWPWFEDSLTYCNGRLSQALIVSGDRMHRRDMIDAGMRSLESGSCPCNRRPTNSSPRLDRRVLRTRRVASGLRPAAGRGLRDGVERVWTPTGVKPCKDSRWATHARWAFNWFLLGEPPATLALRPIDGRLSRRAARRPAESEPGRRSDALVPARLARDAEPSLRWRCILHRRENLQETS